MKQRRTIKVGDKVRYSDMRGMIHVAIVTNVSTPRIDAKLYENSEYVVFHRRQIHSVFVPKKKVEPQYVWCNQYDDGTLGAASWDKYYCDSFSRRKTLFKMSVIERIKCP